MRDRRAWIALVLAVFMTILAAPPSYADDVPLAEPTAEPEPEATPEPEPASEVTEPAPVEAEVPVPDRATAPALRTGAAEVDEPEDTKIAIEDAQLRWGVNNESSNAAFLGGTYNFFSAGKAPDTLGGQLAASKWSATSGSVAIEKWNGSSYQRATWAGLSTDSAGVKLTNPLSGQFSNHTVVLSKGEGTVDPTTGDATIKWTGDFTVIYYSGLSMFYVSDPQLTVEDGVGTLTARGSGFSGSREGTSGWGPVAERTVTLANLGDVDLSDEQGFTATPAYAGIRVTGVPQVTNGPAFGAFPQSFVDFANELGTAAFWYSSGGSNDAFKVALPLTVSYDASNEVTPTPPPTVKPPAKVTNDVVNPPSNTPLTAPNLPVSLGPAPAASLIDTVPLDGARAVALTAASALPARRETPDTLLWWLGTALLTLAAGCVAAPFAFSSPTRRT